MDENKIINFNPDSKPTMRLRPPKRPCYHNKHIIVSEHARTVECEECEAVIDPFEFLMDWAKGNSRWEHDLKRLKDECKRIGKRIATLKRLERNAKNRCGKHMKLPESWVLESLIEHGKMPWS